MVKKVLDVPSPTAEEIAKKWKRTVSLGKRLIAAGEKVEREHTNDPSKANEIARDHLGERPDYYKKLAKMEKSKIVKEESGVSGVGGVRGLGFVSGDPAANPINQYIDTNAMSYEDENGNKLAYIKKAHVDLHNSGLGYNFFDPTKIGSASNFMMNMQEGTTTGEGTGGLHSPKGEGEKYLDNNVKSIDRDAKVREDHADAVHHSLHGVLGFNAFRHTNVKGHSNKELTEARQKVDKKLNELGLQLEIGRAHV